MQRKNQIIAIISDLSGLDPVDLDASSTFLELGFDSLFLTQLSRSFQNEFGIKITFRQLFDDLSTIDLLASFVDKNLPTEKDTPMEPQIQVVDAIAFSPPEQGFQQEDVNMPQDIDGVVPDPGSLEAVLTEQLKLMSQQLAVLRGATMEKSGRQAPIDSDTAPSTSGTTPLRQIPAAPKPLETPEPKPSLPSGFGPQVPTPQRARGLTDRQQKHISQLVAEYNERTVTSKELAQKYRNSHADPRTAAGFHHLWKKMVYPIVIKRSLGSKLWDVDDNEYVDILNGFGANFLGHSPPFVTEALKAQLDRGIEIGPQTPLAGQVAELICEFTGMERATFVNTGSEAVQASMRVARTVTGRDKIVCFVDDYHGNFDEVLVRAAKSHGKPVSFPLAGGIPRSAVENVLMLDYGTDESLEIIRNQANELAAILVEPMQSRRPEFHPHEFLHEVRKITEASETLLIFDEVITGFRTCPGGAQEYYGIKADLATYGKVIAGGMPIGVVAGKAPYMDTFDGGMWEYGDDSFPTAGVTFFAGTFVRHPLAIAAAHATLNYLKEQGPELQLRINEKTEKFAAELNAFFEENGIDIHVAHFSSQMYIRVKEKGDLATLLFYHLRNKGVHVLEGFPSYLTAAHTEEDLGFLVNAFKESIADMQEGDIFRQPTAESETEFPLTNSQAEVWIASQMSDIASCAYNESDTIGLRGPLNIPLFCQAVQEVVARHQALNLRFSPDGDFQRAETGRAMDVPLLDLSGLVGDEQSARISKILDREATLPFDLVDGPLVRTHIIKLEDNLHLFVIYAHHLVFDGWSSDVVLNEISVVYSAHCLGKPYALPEPTPFSVFAAEQIKTAGSAEAKEDLDYWLQIYSSGIPALDLPTDRPRPKFRSYDGGTVHSTINPTIYKAAKEVAAKKGVTLYTLLLATYKLLLFRLSGQKDIVVGIPVAGQAATGKDALVGYCINLLPLRSSIDGSESFEAFLTEIRTAILDAYDHQNVTLSNLLGNLRFKRDTSRSPLVEVVFNFSSYFSGLNFYQLRVTTEENPRRAVNFDLFLNIVEDGSSLVIDWDYNTDLFDSETIRRWIGHLEVLLEAIAKDSNQSLDQLPLLSKEERDKLLVKWNR